MRKKLIFVTILSVIIGNSLLGQLDPSFKQNQFNAMVLNPAQVGAENRSSISVNGQKSWLGIEGSPKTFNAMLNLNVTDKLGLGVLVLNDELGPVKTNRVGLSSAYHLKINKKWRASLGISTFISNTVVDLPSLTTTVLSDPHLQTVLNSGSQLRVGFGGLIYSEKVYFGISQPTAGEVEFVYSNMQNFIPTPSFVAYTGTSIDLNREWQFRPNLTYRFVKSMPTYLDMAATFTYDKTIDLGLTYQLMSGLGVLLGVEVNNLFYAGYSYTYPTSRLNTAASQSHEVSLRFKFGKEKKSFGFQSPRFFN